MVNFDQTDQATKSASWSGYQVKGTWSVGQVWRPLPPFRLRRAPASHCAAQPLFFPHFLAFCSASRWVMGDAEAADALSAQACELEVLQSMFPEMVEVDVGLLPAVQAWLVCL